MAKIFTREQIAPVVLNLSQPQGQDKLIKGTGTFVANSKNELYIVTAAHVAADMNISGHLVIGDENDQPFIIGWDQLTDETSIPWQSHDEADISIVRIQPNEAILPKLIGRFLPATIFYTEKESPSRDVQLTSVGFPLGLGVEGYFSPLTFTSRASSGLLTLRRADTNQPCTFFILENPSIGGYSGCPVFDLAIRKMGAMTSIEGETRCHGIMHGTISDETGGKLAAVTPAYYLLDLIEK